MDWQTLFFKADGRMGKKDFWVGFGIIFLFNMLFSSNETIGWLVSLATLWGSICVYAKRFHDFDKSGWWMLFPIGTYIAAVIAAALTALGAGLLGSAAGGAGGAWAGALLGAGLGIVFIGIAAVVNLVFVLWVGTKDGDLGDNRFGPKPDVPLVSAF